MDEDKLNALLAQEYLQLQKAVEDFDGRALTIKAWSVTFSAGGLTIAFAQNRPAILLLASAGALVFWLVEALWKVNQQAYYPRIAEIEAHFRGEGSTQPLQTTQSWGSAFHRRRQGTVLLSLVFWPHVALPHVLVAIAGVALYGFAPPG
jgi:hypothetical protein